VRVEVNARGMPQRIDLGMAVGPRGKRRVARDARWIEVLDVAEVWRIGEEWWR